MLATAHIELRIKMAYKRKRASPKGYKGRALYKKKKTSGLTRSTLSEGRITKLNPRLGITGFPNSLQTTLRYADVILLTSTVGSVAQHSFRMNSLQDPDFTGFGHKPYYVTQFGALYKRYSVRSAKITAKFSHIANTTSTVQPSGPTVVGITSDDDGLIPTVLTTAMEDGSAMSTYLNNALGGNNVKTLSTTYNPARDLGIDSTNDSLVTAVGTNPSRQWFANIWMAETGLASPTTVAVKIEIVYDVVFSELNNVTGS